MPSSNKDGPAEAERRIAEAKRTGATELDLSGLDLKGLTETVGELVQLQLFLNGNRLKQLPQSIGQLTRLQTLFLAGNQLKQLPESIGQLALAVLEMKSISEKGPAGTRERW
jgi:Leucine-rich repeat (LRR) protein